MAELNHDEQDILESGFFSATWYLGQYQDVAFAGRDPLAHYLSYGATEGRDPGPEFSTSGYLARYHDVAATGINPLLHYIRYGKKEGRLTTPCLDPSSIRRPYRDFGEYLTYCPLDPLVKAPFAKVDKNCFEFMERVARWLCLKLETCESPPLVSVIMPVHNRVAVLGDAVRSALDQTYPNFELIVVDDGSRDDSVSLVRSFDDPRILLLEINDPVGVSGARNRGLEVAEGDLIAYLDSDNTWRPDYLSAMTGFFQIHSDADAAYGGQHLYRGCESEPFAVRFGSYNPSLLRNRNYIDLNCFVHRRDILEAIGGGFCEEIKRWVDWELIQRISRAGKIYAVPILLSNYFLDKAENTITANEEMQPARDYILAKSGYGGQKAFEGGVDQLTRKVAVIVVGDEGQESLGKCIESLEEYSCNPLIEVLVAADLSETETACSLRNEDRSRVKMIGTEPGIDLLHAANQALGAADPDSDVLLLNRNAALTQDALTALQKAAYTCDSIAMVAPQQVLPRGEPSINSHVPYAFNDVPCDITLSNHHKNIETLPLFHAGGTIDLNFASFFCLYIKREIWDECSILGNEKGGDGQTDRIICDFVRHVLEKRIVYTPDAVVLHR